MVSAIGLCILAAQLAVATPATPATAAAVERAVVASVEVKSSQQTLTLINNERAQEGLPSLKWNEQLTEAARRHAELLARNQQLSHRFPNEAPLQTRLENVGVRFLRAGENVAVNYNAPGAHVAFMHSPSHRANILNSNYDEVGVAVVNDGDLLYFVEDFAQQEQQRTTVSTAGTARILAQRFEDMTKRTNLGQLEQVQDARVQDWACAVAQDPSTAAQGASLLGAKYALVFSSAKPDDFPETASWLKAVGSGDHYAIGVCFSDSPRYPNGRYFVSLALFAAGSQTATDRPALSGDSPVASILSSPRNWHPACTTQVHLACSSYLE